jgi:hypothetical protein
MQQLSKCWVCGRGVDEIRATLASEETDESGFNKLLQQVAWHRSKLNDSAALWRRSLPKEFEEMDFNFVMNNPEQFKGFTVIPGIKDTRGMIMDWLAKASMALRKGDEAMLGDLKLASLNSYDRVMVLKSLEQFEGRWHRLFTKDEGQDARKYQAGFEGLSLRDGLEYLISGGVLYYDTQNMLIQIAKNEEEAKKPKMGVGTVQLRGFGVVPVCDVCRGIVVEFRGPREEVEAAVAEAVAPSPEPTHRPQVAPKVAQPAPRKAKTQEAVEASAQASPAYLEIVEKLSSTAPAEGEAPKLRGLHEHRLKEDWEQILEQQQKEGS